MLDSALIIRWLVSIVIMILLLLAFYIVLRFFKEKGYDFKDNKLAKKIVKEDKMQIVEQLFLDSKTKLVKVKDGNSTLTILVGQGCKISKEETK